LLVVALVGLLLEYGGPCHGCRLHSIPGRAREADRQVERAYRQARRQMNEAVGQHWRNLAD
jgi:hypothetical protein